MSDDSRRTSDDSTLTAKLQYASRLRSSIPEKHWFALSLSFFPYVPHEHRWAVSTNPTAFETPQLRLSLPPRAWHTSSTTTHRHNPWAEEDTVALHDAIGWFQTSYPEWGHHVHLAVDDCDPVNIALIADGMAQLQSQALGDLTISFQPDPPRTLAVGLSDVKYELQQLGRSLLCLPSSRSERTAVGPDAIYQLTTALLGRDLKSIKDVRVADDWLGTVPQDTVGAITYAAVHGARDARISSHTANAVWDGPDASPRPTLNGTRLLSIDLRPSAALTRRALNGMGEDIAESTTVEILTGPRYFMGPFYRRGLNKDSLCGYNESITVAGEQSQDALEV